MMDKDIGQLITQLGLASPFIGLLVWLLTQANKERVTITTQFLATLTETLKINAEINAKLASGMSELTTLIKEASAAAAADRTRLSEMLTRIELKVKGPA